MLQLNFISTLLLSATATHGPLSSQKAASKDALICARSFLLLFLFPLAPCPRTVVFWQQCEFRPHYNLFLLLAKLLLATLKIDLI